jgi:DNA-binding MarR family transcriptional regulator
LELLKVEGLVESGEGAGDSEDELLRLNAAGRTELQRLLTANMRAPINDINKLIIALKMRFLHLLEPAEQRLQAEALAELSERELARLTELRAHHSGGSGHLVAWLDQDIAQVDKRLNWFRDLLARLG